MTVSVASDLGVVFDHEANSAVRTGAANTDFDDLFRAHYDRLVRSLTVACGDREQAADAVQEAFVKAHVRWRRIGRYDDPIGWVRRVAINHLRDDHRRTTRKWGALARLAARTPISEQPAEPDELGRLLAALPRQQRIATALYYVDGMSVAEIATTLDLADGTVKSHLHDARVRLRAVLDDERRTDHGR
jgi:RNA polymerase sigma-70 factor, ECF subfamily